LKNNFVILSKISLFKRGIFEVIDEKGRLGGKINIIDLAIVLVIIALIGGFLYKDKAASTSPTAKTMIVKIVCPNAFPGVEKNLKVGDYLVANSALTSAKITEMTVDAAKWVAPDSNGKLVLSRSPLRKDIYLTLEGVSPQYSSAEISFGGQMLRAGKEDFVLKTQKVELKAIVISIEEKS
jgi:hypothetical protein